MPRKITLLHGDSFVLLEDLSIKVTAIITDPPYNLSPLSGGGSINKKLLLNKSLLDLKINEDITKGYDIEKFADYVHRLQGNDINCYFFCNKNQILEYFRVYIGKYGCKFDLLFWHKTNAMPTYSNKYLSDTEYILHFYKGGGATHPSSYEDAKTYFMHPINLKDKREWGHPTIKPIPLISKLIRNSTKEGDLVLDPFMGSGTTGVCCRELKRNFIGIEINKEYFNIAKKRVLNK